MVKDILKILPSNGQTHSNNLSTSVFDHFVARVLKYVSSFFNIMHESVRSKAETSDKIS